MDPRAIARATDHKAVPSLRASFWDGAFASAMTGFTADYFTPFLLALGGTTQAVGVLSALQNVASALGHLASPDWTVSIRSRRVIINASVFVQAVVLLFMAVLARSCSPLLAFFMALVFLFAGSGAVSLPAWMSLMSDLI